MPQLLNSVRYDTLVATFVGVCALGVSAYTAHVQREQVRAMVWPILEYETSNQPDVNFALANKGVGPAIIQRVKVKVDGQPVTKWHDALQKLLGPGEHYYLSSSMAGRVLAPRESIEILVPTDGSLKRLVPKSSPLADQMTRALSRVSIEVCFGSTLGDSWTLRSERGARNIITATRSVPAPSADDFQE